MRSLLLASLVLSIASASCSGDSPQVCTQIGCTDGMTIQLEPPLRASGAYEVEVSLDGRVVTCTGTLPFPECGTPGTSCDSEDVALTASGCALAPSAHEIPELSIFSSNITTIDVTLRRNDNAMGGARLTPTWTTVQPNGPRCGPTCTQAETVSVSTSGL